MTRTLDIAALELVRAIFELAEINLPPSIELLGRLLDTDVNHAFALLAGLRRAGLVQQDRLGLTMAGLVVASSAKPIELRPMRAPVRILRVA